MIVIATLLALATLNAWTAFWCVAVLVALAGAALRLNYTLERAYSRREQFWR